MFKIGDSIDAFGEIYVLNALPVATRKSEGEFHYTLNFEGAQPPDEVADDVVRSLGRNRTEATSGWVSWGVWWCRRLCPRGVRFFMMRKVWKFARRTTA